MRDLIRQLQAFAQGCRGSMWQSRNETIRLMDEAAAALTTANAEADALRAEVKALRADLREHLGGMVHEAEWMIEQVPCNQSTREGVRARIARARAALERQL